MSTITDDPEVDTEDAAPPARTNSNYLRVDKSMSLADLRGHFTSGNAQTAIVDSDDLRVDVDHGTISFKPKEAGEVAPIEIPLWAETLEVLGGKLGIPIPFLRRADSKLQGILLTELLDRNRGDMLLEYTGDTIVEIRNPGQDKIDPTAVLDVAARVVGDDAVVLEGWRNAAEFRFDVLVADGAAYGIGGDLREGDITKGGLRFGQNIKSRLAPWVETLMYRLICTNGMEVAGQGGSAKLHGNSLAEAMQNLESLARSAFDHVEEQISAFYDLREKKVGSAEQMILRIGREQGISSSILTKILETVPVQVEDPDNASMFEVVNAITNMGNHPTLVDRPDRRRKLEVAGGEVVSAHHARCPRCQSSL